MIYKLKDLNLEIGDGNYSSKYPKSSEFTENGIPFLSASDFNGKSFDFSNVKYISNEMHSELKKGHLKKDDLIIVVRGNGVGKTGFLKDDIGECNMNAQLAFIRSKDDRLLTEYLYYDMQYNLSSLQNLATGSAQPQLVMSNLLKYSIDLPDIEKQKMIVKILSDIDNKILLNKKISNDAENINTEIFNNMFSSKLKDKNELQKLEKIVTFSQGKQIDIDNQFFTPRDELVRFLRIIDYTNPFEPKRYVANYGDRYLVRKNDIIVIRYGSQTVGKVVRGYDGLIANNMFKVNPVNDNLTNYLYYYLKSDDIQNEIHGGNNSSTMPSINFGLMNNLNVYIPSDDELNKFNKIVDTNFLMMIQLNENNDTLIELKNILLNKFFVK